MKLESGDIECVLVLITDRKSHMVFRTKFGVRWPWMTLNGVMAAILRYSTEFGRFGKQLH